MIDFTTILRDGDRAYVAAITDVFLEAQRYYIEHYTDETRAALKARGR